MAVFSLRFVSSDGTQASSFTEGQTAGFGFIILWDAAVASDTVIRWEVIFSGRLPLSVSDFTSGATLSGTYTATASTDPRQSAIIPLNILDDSIAEPPQDLVVRLSLDSTNTNTAARIDSATNTDSVAYSTIVADNDSGTVVEELFGGNSNANIFTAGETTASRLRGAGGDDQYVITRYQTSTIDIADSAGDDVIRFDAGVSIGNVTFLEDVDATSNLSNGARVAVDDHTRFSYQIGDGAELTWAAFFALARNGYEVGASSYLDSNILGSGGQPTPILYGGFSTQDDVFAAGEDTPARLRGAGGNDVYIITRFQNNTVDIADSAGDDVIKFDVGVSIGNVTFFEDVDATINLSNGARVTVDDHTRFQYQIGDDEILGDTDTTSWNAFLALASSGYTVPGLPNLPPIGADDIILVNADGSHSFEADDFGYRDQNYDDFATLIIVTVPSTVGTTLPLLAHLR